ncbi:Uncharacterised protein [Mycobacterium tuberculosis]|uniref:Uncharacterized protein n=1 Tax=Mycobacterium tuberculosis TaxID=1773 RepID=A0A654U0X9_MYCTX|nr:Uncharacterised protein [Mycobacterium tuberculosis]CFR82037.1 Uncharacterised protein [Mycobacterium tuberculosis]CKT24601.1 Uncharacterised protein [Mycobacterium tuberculosis]CKW38769.1 Uncharacterised protein [Mycobacterium tuberculosis]CNV51895.1 Uncharacterised protein [Mycobacterium tuberculosis]
MAGSPRRVGWAGRSAHQGCRFRCQPRRRATGRRQISAAPGSKRHHRPGGERHRRCGRSRGYRMVCRTRGLRLACRRRLCRIRCRSGRPGAADSAERQPGRLSRPARSGVHGVVEPGDDRSSAAGSAGADSRRGQRHRQPRDPGGPRPGSTGGDHRRLTGETGALSRPGRPNHHQLPRRGFRRAAEARDRW